jgi:flagellar motor protein MotB
MDGQIIKQSASYRQGLVLGLTMAEIMILLVFCLLFAMTAFLRSERAAKDAAQIALEKEKAEAAQDHQLVRNLSKDPRLADLLRGAQGSNNPTTINEFWRDLVESQGVASAAKDAGLTEVDLRRHGKDLKALAAKGITPQKALRDAAIAASADRALGSSAPATPDVVSKAILRGQSAQAGGGHKWPPIITLNDAAGQFFKSGSAELNPNFRQKLLDKTAPEIARLIREYDVDVIEVVGHTDEKPVGGVHQSNLDRDLLPVLRSETAISSIVPADNAGLGLARAASVVSVLLQNRELSGVKILPLSGGQLIDTNETLAIVGTGGDVAERRRIEIRLRKANPAAVKTVQAPAPRKPFAPVPKPRVVPAQLQRLPPPPSTAAAPPKPVYPLPDVTRIQ